MTSQPTEAGVPPRPEDDPGFGRALASGLLPHTPAGPPRLRHGATAYDWMRRTIIVTASWVAVVIVVIQVGADGARLPWPAIVDMLSIAAAGCASTIVVLGRYGAVQLDELASGYTTCTYEAGGWWVGRRAPYGTWTTGMVGWDWSGVWHLDRHGTPRRPPAPTQAPQPGWYPVGDAWWLWTGSQWSGLTRARPGQGA